MESVECSDILKRQAYSDMSTTDRQNDKGGDIPPFVISPIVESGKDVEDQHSKASSESLMSSARYSQVGDRPDSVITSDSEVAIHIGCNISLDIVRYKMDHKNRGNFVIFNHKNFDIQGAPTRNGTDIDRRNLDTEATKLGFTVTNYDDLTMKQVIETIKKYAANDHTESDCFACAILTHGGEGGMLYARDVKYSEDKILSAFRGCKTLWGKPKLFFIQACRGQEVDDGVKFDTRDADGRGKPSEPNYQIVPTEADFFLGYSTIEGYYAWKHAEKGSWFIQALSFCLGKYGGYMELQQIMTRVNRMVAYNFESNTGWKSDFNKKKQMPSAVNRLTGDVYFSSKNSMQPEGDDETLQQRSSAVITQETLRDRDREKNPLEEELIEAKLKLVRISRQKLQLKLNEQEIRERIYERELQMLKH